MQALLTVEAQRATSKSYHILSEDRTRSLCGAVSAESQFASEMHRVLTQQQAEERGFEVCGRCETIAESKSRV